MNNSQKKIMFTVAFIRFAEMWANNNYGSVEVDVEKLTQYVTSNKFSIIDSWDLRTEEAYYIHIENLILGGFPIWDYLKISEWTKMMLEKEFMKEVAEEEKELKAKYVCYSCSFFDESITSFGVLQRCDKIFEHKFSSAKYWNKPFKLKTKCKYLEKENKI